MNKIHLVSGLIVILILIGIVGFFLPHSGKQESAPRLSDDGKSIIQGNATVLDISDDRIFTFFKNDPWCRPSEEYHHGPFSKERYKPFCEEKASFRNSARFIEIVVSPDAEKIGFTIETDEIQGDKTAGIFLRTTDNLRILTNYYLGNEFISFSPSGKYFVYKEGCFEAMCNAVVKDSKTLETKIYLTDDDAEHPTEKSNTVFVRWVSDNEVEYKVGNPWADEYELKRASW